MPSPDTIYIRAAVPARTDWASVLALVLKTFAYMIDSPFSANRQMQEAMAVQAMSGIVLLAIECSMTALLKYCSAALGLAPAKFF